MLLDEPTNDLDVQTLSVLEDFLEDFRGCVIVVSHDRYFLDRTVDRLFWFEQGRLHQFEGNYSAFLERQRLQERERSASTPAATGTISAGKRSAAKQQGPRRRSFKENQELEQLDQQLPELERRRRSVEKQISDDGADIASLSHELAELIVTIESAEERWLELSELVP